MGPQRAQRRLQHEERQRIGQSDPQPGLGHSGQTLDRQLDTFAWDRALDQGRAFDRMRQHSLYELVTLRGLAANYPRITCLSDVAWCGFLKRSKPFSRTFV